MVDLKFKTFREFKDAVAHHSIPNGRETNYLKNDRKRCRIGCKKECDFLVMASKVGGSQTFKIKSWVSKHTCGRVCDNKNAASRWISNMIVVKYMPILNVKLNEIEDDVRQNNSVGITPWKTFKARKMAKEVLEGDSSKQYSILWSYCADSKDSCVGNTAKIDMISPTSGDLQPRFDSFYMSFDGF